MEMPHQKTHSSPITGRSPRLAEPPPGSQAGAPGPGEADLEVSGEVFERPVISLPPRSAPREAARQPAPEAPAPPPAENLRRKMPLRRNSGNGVLPFKRHMTRPETAYTAHAAADLAKSETPVSTDRIERGSMQFGKIHLQSNPDYRPNRLFTVLDNLYTHSPLKWVDFLDRTGPRTFVILGFLITGGIITWRYVDSLRSREAGVSIAQETGVPAAERVARGRACVEAYLAAKTIGEKLLHVVDSERARPRMEAFYNLMHGTDPKVQEGWHIGEPVEGKQGAWMPFTFTDGTGMKIMVALSEDDEVCHLDWENFVAFSEVPWLDYCTRRPITPTTARVRLRPVEKYEGPYTKDKWQSYELAHRSGGPVLTGYADRSSRTSQALAAVVRPDTWQSAQLYLRFETGAPEGTSPVIIDDLIRSRWQDEVTEWTAPAGEPAPPRP